MALCGTNLSVANLAQIFQISIVVNIGIFVLFIAFNGLYFVHFVISLNYGCMMNFLPLMNLKAFEIGGIIPMKRTGIPSVDFFEHF